MEFYKAEENRYADMIYRRCGRSGILLPAVSLGLWHNFGSVDVFSNFIQIAHAAFDHGVTHFDLANNYGPAYGSAEENFGRILKKGLGAYRDEMIISTKAGYDMWPGPYGCLNGSRKYLISSLDQSLKRMGLEYVDIFYHHIYDSKTPLEETALALDSIVRSGKALYVGISNYSREQTEEISKIFRELRTPFIVNQISYSMLNRWIERDGLDNWAYDNGVGLAVYSPLYQGLLTDKYIGGVPSDSRIGRGQTWIGRELDDKMRRKLAALAEIAASRGQKLSQLALSWVLKNKAVTTVIIGASRPSQIAENAACIDKLDFSDDEVSAIEAILAE